jgi:hypothetical protein
MKIMTRRKYPRRTNDVPILYAENNAKEYCQAVMRNFSREGMYFESDSPIRSSQDLFIKWQPHRFGTLAPAPYRAFRAKMKWCQRVVGNPTLRYGIGVQYAAKSHLLYGLNIPSTDCRCDFCTHRVIDPSVHLTETGLHLCRECLHFMESLCPIAEKAVERFLIGNVI